MTSLRTRRILVPIIGPFGQSTELPAAPTVIGSLPPKTNVGVTPFSPQPVPMTPFELANRGAPATVLESARRAPPPFTGAANIVEPFQDFARQAVADPFAAPPPVNFLRGYLEGSDVNLQPTTSRARELGRQMMQAGSLERIQGQMRGDEGRLAQVLAPFGAFPGVGVTDPLEAATRLAGPAARVGVSQVRGTVERAAEAAAPVARRLATEQTGAIGLSELSDVRAIVKRANQNGAKLRTLNAGIPEEGEARIVGTDRFGRSVSIQGDDTFLREQLYKMNNEPPSVQMELPYVTPQSARSVSQAPQVSAGVSPSAAIASQAPTAKLPSGNLSTTESRAASAARGLAGTPPPPSAAAPSSSVAAQPPPSSAAPSGGGVTLLPGGTPPAGGVPPGAVGPIPPAGRSFVLEQFQEPARRLVPDTATMQRIRNTLGARQVFGRVVNRAQMELDNPAAVLSFQRNIFRESQASRAHAAVLEWANEAQQTLGFDVRGIAKKVRPANPGVSGKLTSTIFDLVEHPERYVLTPEQENTIRRAQSIMDSVLQSERAAGVDVNAVVEYWPRQVVGGPRSQNALKQLVARQAGKPSAKGHTRGRIFPFAEDTVNAGYKLNLDPAGSLYRRLEAGIDAIANKEAMNRLSALPGARQGLEPTYYERIIATSLAPTPHGLIPTGTILPDEVAEQVYKWLGDVPELPGAKPGRGIASEVFQLWRNAMVVFDAGATFIQSQALFFRNNVAWWRAQAAGMQAIIAQPLGYVAKNIDDIDEGIKMGAIRPPSEFLLQDTGLSSVLPKAPVIGSLAKRINRHLEWSVFVGQTEMYKAARNAGMKEADLVSLGSAIRKMFGSESYAILGIPRSQQNVEAWMFFAPRFYRGLVGLMAQAFTPGAGGTQAKAIMGSLIGGATALTTAVHYATTHELPNYTDPTKSDWGRARLPDGSYMSFYGPFHSYFQVLARASYYTAQGEPKRAATEVERFFTSKAGIPFRTARTAADIIVKGESRTFEGERITASPEGALTFLKEQAPISPANVQQAIAEGRPVEAALQPFGANVRPETPRDLAGQYEREGKGNPSLGLPPAGQPFRVYMTAYKQAGEGLLSEAGRKAWKEYESLPEAEQWRYRSALVKAGNRPLAAELRKVEGYRTIRRAVLARSFPELDVALVDEAWNDKPQRSYRPKTPQGRARLAELRGETSKAPAAPPAPLQAIPAFPSTAPRQLVPAGAAGGAFMR